MTYRSILVLTNMPVRKTHRSLSTKGSTHVGLDKNDDCGKEPSYTQPSTFLSLFFLLNCSYTCSRWFQPPCVMTQFEKIKIRCLNGYRKNNHLPITCRYGQLWLTSARSRLCAYFSQIIARIAKIHSRHVTVFEWIPKK